jgi:hypothetical protein
MHIFFLIQKGSIVPQWAFQVNSAPAMAKSWDLKGYTLKVKLWKQFSLYKQHSLGKPDSYNHLLPQSKKSAVSYFINWQSWHDPYTHQLKVTLSSQS